jgi:hypothetical protein
MPFFEGAGKRRESLEVFPGSGRFDEPKRAAGSRGGWTAKEETLVGFSAGVMCNETLNSPRFKRSLV